MAHRVMALWPGAKRRHDLVALLASLDGQEVELCGWPNKFAWLGSIRGVLDVSTLDKGFVTFRDRDDPHPVWLSGIRWVVVLGIDRHGPF